MFIFGISLIENFWFDFITNFIREMKIISWNILDYLTNTQFYKYLNESFQNNENEQRPSSENRLMTKTHGAETKRSENGISQQNRQNSGNSKISEWLKPEINEVEIKDDTNNGYKKYFIWSTFIVLTCLGWVYFDEIKTGGTSLWEWINSFRTSTSGDSSTDTGSDGTINQKTFKRPRPLNDPDTPDIETFHEMFKAKDKTKILSSPSLDNLNDQAKESWGESSGSKSPDSSSSIETITPSNYSNLTELEIAVLAKVNQDWKEFCPKLTQTKIEFIENNLKRSNNLEMKKVLVEYLSDIEREQWRLIRSIKLMKDSCSEIDVAQSQLIQEKLNN
jgi:hypothetical protein